MAAGIGMATTPATASIVESLPASKQGVASAVNDTAREVGGAVGIAVLGSVLNDGYRDGIAAHAAQLPPEGAERARDSLAFVAGAAEQFGPAGEELLAAGRQAFVDGFNTTMVVAAVVVAFGALVVLGRGRRSPVAHDPAVPDPDGAAERADVDDARVAQARGQLVARGR